MIFARFSPTDFRRASLSVGPFLLALWGAACASAPRPTAASLAIAANPRATIEGRVVGTDGLPVAGIEVHGMPRARDIPWAPPAVTDAEGRFRLTVFAPATYGFFLRWEGRTVITPREDDPARLEVAVAPGERREGIELLFLRETWAKD